MSAAAKIFRCENPSCTLGSRTEHGHFTGGITAAQALILTGNPTAKHGEGICPNCGEAGVATKEKHESHVGKDPHQRHHDAVAAKVAAGELEPADAQAALEELIAS